MKKISSVFSDRAVHLCGDSKESFLNSACLLAAAPEPYSGHILYVCEYKNIPEDKSRLNGMHLLCTVQNNEKFKKAAEEAPENFCMLLVESDDVEEVFLKLQSFFDLQCSISMYADALLGFLSLSNGLQAAVDYSYEIFKNPIFVFDGNFNLTAATWDAIGRLDLQKEFPDMRMSDRQFKMMNRDQNIHRRVRRSETPIVAYNEYLGYDQLYCEINTGKNLGHIVVSAVRKPIEAADTDLMMVLKRYVNEQLDKNSFVRSARGREYEFFLRDILERRILPAHAENAYIRRMAEEFPGNLSVLVVDTMRSEGVVNPIQIRNSLESRPLKCKTIVYGEQVVCILMDSQRCRLSKESHGELMRWCAYSGLYVGLSGSFRGILKLREYYQQALRAIELGTRRENSPGMFCYSDLILEDIKSFFVTAESAETFCHPNMRILIEYDRKHNSDLGRTLYMYLCCERNLSAAANAMRMHRSTLVYRFKKIHELLGQEEFDDYKERMHLLLSYEFCEPTAEIKR